MATKTKEIKVRKIFGLKLEKIVEGSILVFPDGRREVVMLVDRASNDLYTKRERKSSEWVIKEQVVYRIPWASMWSDGGKLYPKTSGIVKKNLIEVAYGSQ